MVGFNVGVTVRVNYFRDSFSLLLSAQYFTTAVKFWWFNWVGVLGSSVYRNPDNLTTLALILF